MNLFKKALPIGNSVVKESIYKKQEKLVYAILVALAVLFSFRYIFWWFDSKHVPSNWINSNLHSLDYALFGVLSFVVFIGLILRFGSWFTLWFASKPKYMKPQKGLKVALLTCYVPGKEPVEMLI